ncbi:hypothetical protein [Salmonella enterica]|uniref:hypothetical protein n=1 Tax=Salmonella enterica TaxID=28901 RepID=UPI0038571C8E
MFDYNLFESRRWQTVGRPPGCGCGGEDENGGSALGNITGETSKLRAIVLLDIHIVENLVTNDQWAVETPSVLVLFD